VKHVAAAWAARSSGPGVLLIMLSARAGLPASLAALDAAAAAVERQAPAEPVRVVLTSVLGVARAVSFSKAGLPRRSPSGERRGRNGFHVLPAVAAVLLGVLVLAVPHWAGWHGAAAIATYVVGGFLAMAGAGAALSGGAGRKAEAGGPPAGGG
jgi:hypothetical protein